jgi:hypothetical protein
VTSLSVGSSFRTGGLCDEQVEKLTALGGAWPPILVRRADGQVIDGAHRVAAARRLGLARLEAELFEGCPEQAFIEFVRRNVTQGLVLSIAERKQATIRILHDHPIWSDRRVAELCALSPKTVARLRPETACPTADLQHLGVREGRDKRLRPVRPGSARARVVEALRDQPDASLRTIAAAVGVSPETVRLARLDLTRVDEPVPHDDEAPTDGEGEPVAWQTDLALASSERGEQFLAWFERTAVAEPDLDWVAAVPLGRIYVVAEEARRRAETWLELARTLEGRAGRGR